MKKFLLALLLLPVLCANAQVAKKYVFIEQFTNASCGPCAAENPVFYKQIIQAKAEVVHHIAYHTSWPGTDPMYNHNTSEVNSRVDYYNVNAVPTFFTFGKEQKPAPGTVDMLADEGSPLKIAVTQNKIGDSLDIRVVLTTIGAIPAGSYKLRTAIVEKTLSYTNAPGSNGETFFPGVFRKMLPSTAGTSYTPAAVGDSVVFTYKHPFNAAWDIDSTYAISFVQNDLDKKIINAGSSIDPPSGITNGKLLLNSAAIASSTSGNAVPFSFTAKNEGSQDESFVIRLDAAHPADWTATFTINGTTYTDSAIITIPAGTSVDAEIMVTPGATGSVGEYSLLLYSADIAGTIERIKRVSVISGVTDLVLSNDGDGSSSAEGYRSVYYSGLQAAGNSTWGGLSVTNFLTAWNAGYLTGVKNIYYNAGFSWPVLTNNLVSIFQNYIDDGGNFLISGQDIGWFANSTSATTNIKNFYANYLQAKYVSDGGTLNSLLKPVTYDNVFGNVSLDTIIDFHGGMYPDEITPIGTAEPIFTYNSPAKIAGLKYYNPNTGSKVVYIAVGLEMLKNQSAADLILKTAHDWFYGTGCYSLNSVTTSNTALLCSGDMNGKATVKLYGGSGNYTYNWSNGAVTDSITGLGAGTYSVMISDDSTGCSMEKIFVVTQPTVLKANYLVSNSSTGSNGSITTTPSGGVSPYKFLWNTGATTKNLSGLAAGTYIVTITDKNGCQRTDTLVVLSTVGVNEASDVITTIHPNPASEVVTVKVNTGNASRIIITVRDICGKTAYEKAYQCSADFTTTLDVADFAKGVYFVETKTEEKRTVTKLVVR